MKTIRMRRMSGPELRAIIAMAKAEFAQAEGNLSTIEFVDQFGHLPGWSPQSETDWQELVVLHTLSKV
jgi:hypothetical protein